MFRIWRTIDIEIRPVARRSYELESMLLLERSRNLPIDVCVVCDLGEYDVSDAELRSIFSMLIPHIHRWRKMAISVVHHLLYAFLSTVSDLPIPAALQLTALELYQCEGTNEYDSLRKHLTLFGGSAPLLTRIVLYGVHVDWNQPWIASASNLTHLELAFHPDDVRPSWAQFATILRGAPALEKLTLHLSKPSGDTAEWFIEPTPESPTDLNSPIQLPRLTIFLLAFHLPAPAIGVLRRLCLPALKTMVLASKDSDGTALAYEVRQQTNSPAAC